MVTWNHQTIEDNLSKISKNYSFKKQYFFFFDFIKLSKNDFYREIAFSWNLRGFLNASCWENLVNDLEATSLCLCEKENFEEAEFFCLCCWHSAVSLDADKNSSADWWLCRNCDWLLCHLDKAWGKDFFHDVELSLSVDACDLVILESNERAFVVYISDFFLVFVEIRVVPVNELLAKLLFCH